MKSFQSIEDEYLRTVFPGSKNTPLNLSESRESFFSVENGYLRNLGRMNGVRNKMDERNQAAQLLSEFKFLCEHNLLFYLTVTNRFEIIRELFTPYFFFHRIFRTIGSIHRARSRARAHKNKRAFTPKKNHSEMLAGTKEDLQHSIYRSDSMNDGELSDCLLTGKTADSKSSFNHRTLSIMDASALNLYSLFDRPLGRPLGNRSQVNSNQCSK